MTVVRIVTSPDVAQTASSLRPASGSWFVYECTRGPLTIQSLRRAVWQPGLDQPVRHGGYGLLELTASRAWPLQGSRASGCSRGPTIGRLRGGRTTTIHALTLLTGGHVPHCVTADVLLDQLPTIDLASAHLRNNSSSRTEYSDGLRP